MSLNIRESMITYANELVHKAVMICSEEYGFDSTEALRLVGLVGVEEKVKVSKKVKEEKDKGFRGAFPLPYNGVVDEKCCHGLKHTYGLFTQCKSASKGDAKYCKTCQNQADKNDNGEPTCGTIESRSAVDILEYVDPKGRTTVAYSEVLKKLNLSMEDALSEAAKVDMTINEVHLLDTEPRKEKVVKVEKGEKEKVEKKGKGRPKKAEKVLELEESDDLFSSLVSAANQPVKKVKKAKEPELTSEDIEEKEVEAPKKVETPKADEAPKAVKEVKVEELEEEEEVEVAKAPKKVEAPKAVEVAKTPKKVEAPKAVKVEELEEEEEEEEEEDEVVRIVYQGKKYLRSENTGVVYNDDDEQDVVGCWNKKTKKIDFDEEEE